ncbi:hypothetical protein pdam_00019277 [Pocillopora damicornis]|uniref:Uncharacterized protein n=1 Tax=Pocillopora damicornis TaxID=46731 RepID=A0A3M6UDS5_POCDA|nr:hypothetical protein pdam_00019277 [Pocillopora damicornis]
MSTDNVSINTHHKHSKKKCNEKDKWSVTVGTSCGNQKELFCCATSDGSTQNETEKRSDTHCQMYMKPGDVSHSVQVSRQFSASKFGPSRAAGVDPPDESDDESEGQRISPLTYRSSLAVCKEFFNLLEGSNLRTFPSKNDLQISGSTSGSSPINYRKKGLRFSGSTPVRYASMMCLILTAILSAVSHSSSSATFVNGLRCTLHALIEDTPCLNAHI